MTSHRNQQTRNEDDAMADLGRAFAAAGSLDMPHSTDVEKTAIACLLLDQTLPKDYEINREIFQTPSHRAMFEAMQNLDRTEGRFDPSSIAEYLRVHGELDLIGGQAMISQLYGYGIRSELKPALKKLNDLYQKKKVWKFAHWLESASLNGIGSLELLEQARQQIDDIQSSRGAVPRWPEVLPLPGGRLKAPPLDEKMIPVSLRPWLLDIAHQLQVPKEYATVPAVIALATVLGAKIQIKPKRKSDWRVVCNLWGSVVGDPGTLKSPAISAATKPLRRLVAEAKTAFEEAKEAFNLDAEIAEEEKKEAIKRWKAAVLANEDPKAIEDLRAAIPGSAAPPVARRYMVNQATIQVVARILSQNPNGILVFRDELIGWMKGLENENNSETRTFFLEAWNGGEPFEAETIGRGLDDIKSNTISVVGGIQPGPLMEYVEMASQSGGGADGLFQRFQLMVWPEEIPDWTYVDDYPNSDAKNSAYRIFKWMDALTPENCSEIEDGNGIMRFDDQAQELFIDWVTDLNKRIRSGRYEPAFKSMLSKYGSLFASLALIFHLADISGAEGKLPPVSFNAAKLALMWCDWLEAHARKVYGLKEAEADESVKKMAAKLIARKLPETFQIRHVTKREWTGLEDTEVVTTACDFLVELGWLIKKEEESKVRGGKPKEFYIINPNVENQGE